MRRILVRRITFAALISTCLIRLAQAQRVPIQVSDYQERPIQGAILSGKGPGTSTSAPTDLSGKTQVIPPPGAQPGDPLSLSLVKAPNSKMIIMSPFEGHATVPKSPWFVEVILGEPGDSWALKDERVVSTWAFTLIELNKVEQAPRQISAASPPPPASPPSRSTTPSTPCTTTRTTPAAALSRRNTSATITLNKSSL